MPITLKGTVEKYGESPSICYDVGSGTFRDILALHDGKHIQITISVKEIK